MSYDYFNVNLNSIANFAVYLMQVKSVDEYFPTYRKLWDYNRHIIRDHSQPYRAGLFDC